MIMIELFLLSLIKQRLPETYKEDVQTDESAVLDSYEEPYLLQSNPLGLNQIY